jgi:hypothetical protein
MTVTCSPKALESFVYNGKKALEFKAIPTRFFKISVNCFPKIPVEEASDLDLLTLSEKMGVFSFLGHPDEDIYSLSDGNPIA